MSRTKRPPASRETRGDGDARKAVWMNYEQITLSIYQILRNNDVHLRRCPQSKGAISAITRVFT